MIAFARWGCMLAKISRKPDSGLQIGLESAMKSPRMTRAEALVALRRRLDLGEWRPHDRLPPERDLAAMLGCSRETIRHALHQLEIDGIIWRHHGKGTFAGPGPAKTVTSFQRVVESASFRDLIEARLVIEPAIAAAAARAATAGDIAEMQCLAEATGTATNWHDYECLDDAFHRSIAYASGSPLLIGLYTHLASVRGRAPWQRQHDAVFRKARKQEYSTAQSVMHMAIVDSIIRKDELSAHQSMSLHLAAIRELLSSVT